MSEVDFPDRVCMRELLLGGMSWSAVIRRGNALRLTALADGANVSLLLFNADQYLERYNMPDTLKAQHTFMLTRGHICYSDMGHALMSIIEDTCGWHDTVCGLSTHSMLAQRYGEHGYQAERNAWHRNGRDLLLVELGKHGLGKRDLVANINLFSKVSTDGEGNLYFDAEHARAGQCVDLRADMNVLVVAASAPHPLDPCPVYRTAPVQLEVWDCGLADAEDVCRLSRPENVRGLAYTQQYFCQHHY